MRPYTPVLVMLGVVAVSLLVLAGAARAVHTGLFDEGCAQVGVEDVATGSNRAFRIATDVGAGTPGCDSPADTWDFEPGDTVTVEYRETTSGLNPPPTPDTVIIDVYDDDTSTQIVELHNGAPPADTTTFSFELTTDGAATGTDIRGTVRLRVRVIDDPPLTTSDYDCSSDGEETTGVLVDCLGFIAGGIRSATIVDSISHGGYPAGTQYAFGTAGNEQVTCTANGLDRVFGIKAYAEHRIRVVRGADQSVIHDGGFSDATTLTSLSTTDTIDNSYDSGRTTYGCDYTVQGNSPLSGLLWTIMAIQASHGSGVIRLSDSQVWDSNVFDANPDVFWDADGTGPADGSLTSAAPTPANRGESVTVNGFLLNARGEQLTRSLTIRVRDAVTNGIEHSASDTGASYGFTYSVAATDQARHNAVGAGKHLTAATTGLTEVFTNSTQWAVSSLYQVDPHIQNGTARPLVLSKDDFPTEDATENLTHQAGTDFAQSWVHVVGVRGQDVDTTGGAVTLETDDSDALSYIVATISSDTGSDGWTPALYDPTDGGVGLGSPLGGWNLTANVSFTGNTGEAVQPFTVALGNATAAIAQTHIVVDVDGLDAGDLIHLLLFFGVLLLGLWRGWLFVSVAATLATLAKVVDSETMKFLGGFVLILAAIWLEYVSWRWPEFLPWKRDPGSDKGE